VASNPKPDRNAAIFPTDQEIAELAYEMFFDHDRHRWCYSDCYRRAQDLLLQQAANRVIRAYEPLKRRR